MKMMKLGKSGIEISKIGLGTWAIGGGPAWNREADVKVCIETIVKRWSWGSIWWIPRRGTTLETAKKSWERH